MSTPKVIEVLRISTDAQDLQRQRDDLERNRAAHHLTVARTVELTGVSGRKVGKNDEMNRVLSDLKDPGVDGISISALDRLFRMERFSDYSILDNFKDTGKKIWSVKEGVLDLRTDAGLIISLMSGAQGALEWRELRRRSIGGKETLRVRGGCPDGRQALPRGVDFEPIKDSKGRSIGAKWFYTEPDAGRIKLAYDLLFQRLSWRDIAERIGGGFTYNGVKSSLKNRVWKGYRLYSAGRETPLEIQVIDKPLISAARWQQAQEIILGKRSRWLKTKRPPHMLLSGLLTCVCGAPCYVRCSGSYSGPGSARGYYYCSANCGASSVRQEAADRMAEQFASGLDAKFWTKAFGQMRAAQPARDKDVEKLDRQRAKLETERQRLLQLTIKGTCSEEDYTRESKRIQMEIADLARLAPAPVSATLDPKKMAVEIARTFARFGKQPFEGKRTALRTVFKDLVLEGGNLTGFTLNGGFLDSANSSPRCSRSSTPSS